MADNRITKQKLKTHWHYNRWKYALMAVVCVLGVNLLFSMTAYRPPEDKKLELYLCSGYADTTLMYEDLWPVYQAAAPEQELLTVINIDVSTGDMYSNMQFTTYMGAQEGDVCLLPKTQFNQMIDGGADYALADLTAYVESGAIDLTGMDLAACTFAAESGEMGVYAIPADGLYGLLEFGCDPADAMLVMMGYTQNPDNAAKLMDLMLKRYRTQKPEGYDQMRSAKQEQAAGSTQLFR